VGRRLGGALATAAACLGAATAPTIAGAATTSAAIQPSFQPYRLGARVAATLSLRFSGGPQGVPAPLRGAVLRLPAGLRIDLAGVGVCPVSRLRGRAATGCSPASLLGRGQALTKVHAGSQTLFEQAAIRIFRGPDHGARPSFEILGHGDTPLYQNTLSTAVLEPDTAPYGSKLVVSVPAIPTLMGEPDASFSSLSLTLGRAAGGSPGAVLLPRRCPAGGFGFAASFIYADGSTGSASARLPCP
jgi:hypothetical protein